MTAGEKTRILYAWHSGCVHSRNYSRLITKEAEDGFLRRYPTRSSGFTSGHTEALSTKTRSSSSQVHQTGGRIAPRCHPKHYYYHLSRLPFIIPI